MSAPDLDTAKTAAEKILNENYVVSPPVHVEEICRNYGLSVATTDFGEQHANLVGFIDREKRMIVLNRSDPVGLRVFTAAHALGHWVLHREKLMEEPDRYAVLRRAPIGQLNEDPVESEANCFAAALLVPSELLKPHRHEKNQEKLADIFNVSTEVIGYRLKDVG
ncbi:MAG: ImmA/IrrE family metallo-endopeptidase [Candidatus Omnitrophica bacterium]|nr:ImmA/IrrE family metallo-endopeptidase [Candidatus Omnitrophota bacterium]